MTDRIPIISGAIFSDDRAYRYALWRFWDASKPKVMFIGLNPSTANESEPDNTIKKVIKIAINNGYGGLYMMNLFGIVSADPSILKSHQWPIGGNDKYLSDFVSEVKDIVFCWGNFKEAKERGEWAKRIFPKALCLRHTKDGNPWHPLYCKDDTKLIPFA
jgi:hypothetical protein